MKVSVLRDGAAAFRDALRKGWTSGLEALYETVPHWQAAWPPATPADLPTTIEAALQNSRTRGFWQGHAYYPKEAVIALAKREPDMLNLAFGRLFNSDLDLAQRYSQFVYYLDESLEEFRRANRVAAPPTHYHDDYRMPSLYCCLHSPATHAYFEHEVYQKALTTLEARDISPAPDPERFAKSTKVAMTFLGNTDGWWEAHTGRLIDGDYREVSALSASEFFRFLAS